jgi:hypothetical protein
MPSFSESVLDKRAEDVKEPPVKPAGTYLFLIQGQFVEGVSSQKRTPWVGWNIKCLAAQEDVNREELEAAGGIETWVWRPSAASGLHYYITEDAAFILKQFLVDTLGIDPEGKTIREMMAEAPGRQFFLKLRLQPSQDGTRMRMDIESTAKV